MYKPFSSKRQKQQYIRIKRAMIRRINIKNIIIANMMPIIAQGVRHLLVREDFEMIPAKKEEAPVSICTKY